MSCLRLMHLLITDSTHPLKTESDDIDKKGLKIAQLNVNGLDGEKTNIKIECIIHLRNEIE